MKILYIVHRIGPYHLARLREASRRMGLVVVEQYAGNREYLWERVDVGGAFPHEILVREGEANPSSSVLRKRFREILGRYAPECVLIPGWGTDGAVDLIRDSLEAGLPLVTITDSTSWDQSRDKLREAVKSRILALHSSAFCAGGPHREYLELLGMPKERIFEGYDVVDNDYFHDGATSLRKETGDRYFLSSSRFIEKKNLPRIFDAYAMYLRTFVAGPVCQRPRDLVLLGSGDLKERLLAHGAELGLKIVEGAPPMDGVGTGTLYMPGFVQYGDLPRYYAGALCFVHASTTEQWGVVVNEAMASALPVIISRRCGSARDLVFDGVNGFLFDPYDVGALAQLLTRLSSMPAEDVARMGGESWRLVSRWDLGHFGDGLTKAVECAMKIGPLRPSLIDRLVLSAASAASRRQYASRQ